MSLSAPFSLANFSRCRRYDIGGRLRSLVDNLIDFPLYVPFSSDASMSICRADGYDVAFADASGNILSAERAYWSGGAGSAVTAGFWVKIPTIYRYVRTSLYCYYGRWLPATDCCFSPTSVWGSQYSGVWHLGDTGTNPTAKDSTSNANNSTSQAWTPTTSGIVNRAGSFNGSSQYINLGTSGMPTGNSSVTLSVWINPQGSGTTDMQPALWLGGTGTHNVMAIGIRTSGNYFTMTWWADELDSSTVATVGTWYHLVGTYDGSTRLACLYINGSLAASKTLSSVLTLPSGGAYVSSSPDSRRINAIIDEPRICRKVLPAIWNFFEYHTIAYVGAAGHCVEQLWDLPNNVIGGPSAFDPASPSPMATCHWAEPEVGGPFPHYTRRLHNGGFLS